MSHISVLLDEAVQGLNVEKGKKYIDATFGSGGHTKAISKQGGIVLALDTDPKTKYEGNLVHGNFRDLETIAQNEGFGTVRGILFDLGFSSNQLDDPTRGFSYRFEEASLDMRLDQLQELTAGDIINTYTSEQLYEIFARYGEEQLARSIADAVYRARLLKPIDTVGEFVAIIEKRVKGDRKFGVLARIFQALRIQVNDELDNLRKGLEASSHLLEKNGRLVVISFHSLEDRIVKRFMKGSDWEELTKHPIIPTSIEQEKNIRSRSAKLRIAIKT